MIVSKNIEIQEHTILIPMYEGRVQASFPSPALEYMEERIDILQQLVPHPLATFFVKSEGLSMMDAFIPPGSTLIVDRSLRVQDGDIVVVYLEGGFTVKYLQKKGSLNRLLACNREKYFAPIDITEDKEVIIWGMVTNIIIPTKIVKDHVRFSGLQ